MTGAEVGPAWNAGRYADVAAYNMADVLALNACAAKCTPAFW